MMINATKEAKIRKDERKKVWEEIYKSIPECELPGIGSDQLSIRNGMTTAANIVYDMGIE